MEIIVEVLWLFFIKLQANANNINPPIKNVFSLILKFRVVLNKKKYIEITENTKNGMIFDEINKNIDLNLFASIKYLIPINAFKDSIEEICKG